MKISSIHIFIITLLLSSFAMAGTVVVSLPNVTIPHATNSNGVTREVSLKELSTIHPKSIWNLTCHFTVIDIEGADLPSEHAIKFKAIYQWDLRNVTASSPSGYNFPFIYAESGTLEFPNAYLRKSSKFIFTNLDATADVMIHDCEAKWIAYY